MASGRHSRNTRKVAPEPGSCDNIVEIRPNRTIRIKHLNKRERDDKFEKEMQAYLQYRETGALGSAASIPPHLLGHQVRKDEKKSEERYNQEQTRMPHEILHAKDDTDNNDGGDNTNGPNNLNISQRKAYVQSPSRNSINSAGIQSLTGVHIAVTRPSSEVHSLGQIGESSHEHSHPNTVNEKVKNTDSSAKSPRKTKDHRPVSAKSVRKTMKSPMADDMSDTLTRLPDLENLSQHLSSPYKDVTLFFIHGVGGSADIWNAQLEFFASLGLEVIAPDLIGLLHMYY